MQSRKSRKFRSVAQCLRDGDGRYNDGRSLYLVVKGGSALWEHQYRQDKKLHSKWYGTAVGGRAVTVTQARAMRDADSSARQLDRLQQRLLNGTASLPVPQQRLQQQNGNGAITFAQARDRYLRKSAEEWKPARLKQATNQLTRHTKALDNKPLATITTADIAAVLKGIWKGPNDSLGNRVRSHVEKIYSMAEVLGDVTSNPATWEKLKWLLSNTSVDSTPQASLPWQKVPALWADLVAANGSVTARAIKFIILTGCRQDEALRATWSEFDFKNKLWTVPEEHMKKGREHIVPLSDAAIKVLGTPGASDAFVFPAAQGSSHVNKTSTQKKLLTLRPGVTMHGFRSTLSTWAEECDPPYPPEVITASLSHVKGDKTEQAYRRSPLLAARRKMMDAWERYVLIKASKSPKKAQRARSWRRRSWSVGAA